MLIFILSRAKTAECRGKLIEVYCAFQFSRSVIIMYLILTEKENQSLCTFYFKLNKFFFFLTLYNTNNHTPTSPPQDSGEQREPVDNNL